MIRIVIITVALFVALLCLVRPMKYSHDISNSKVMKLKVYDISAIYDYHIVTLMSLVDNTEYFIVRIPDKVFDLNIGEQVNAFTYINGNTSTKAVYLDKYSTYYRHVYFIIPLIITGISAILILGALVL